VPGRQTDRQTDGHIGREKACQADRQTDIWAEKRIARQTDRYTDRRFVRQTDRKTEKQMDRKALDRLTQFPKEAERRLGGQPGRQVLARQTGLPCRKVCHAKRFAMQTVLPCRQVCHADRSAMQTGLPCRQVCHADRQKAHQFWQIIFK
jgi:hypothetical protein